MSDLTNNNNSAINPNTAKNRKKKQKKKAKKQNTTDSSNTASEISTPNLTDKENIDPSPLSGEASSLPAENVAPTTTAIITDTQTTPANTSTLTGEETQTTPANTSTLTGEGSALATSLPAKPIDDFAATATTSDASPAIITETQTTPANTSTLTGEGSALATSLPAKPIDSTDAVDNQPAPTASTTGPIEGSIHDKNIPAAGPVGPGAHGATATGAAIAAATVGATTATTASHSGGSSSLHEPLPLSDNVQYAIKSAIASRSIHLDGIVDKIKSNVTAGDYKEKAKTPPNAAAVDHKQAQVPTSVNTDAATNPKAAVGTPNNAPAAITTNKDTSDSSKNPLKKAAVGVGAAVAGATAAVAGSHKSGINDNKTGTTTTGSKINNRSAPLPPTPQSTTNSGTTSTTSDVSKLSENVQYCIKSAVQAPSVDVYGIINPSQKVKRPEAAVGPSTQPTMPSSAQAPDVPKKTIKSPEHRHKPSFLKKKNCIIL
ncbi:hypothetical protein HMPREF1544_04439 [Mucor circinelloides 1006PhL]|uniref:Uncharacterized protein n=1 Tax=Mucor circinelloides f. circinelloides (strain 1006PhL) TaxID=1220926 RepID=S2JFX7_MUCC1|nr:hypothetical protein HMPREF1544_04439 [Mucor circinelloides 1006PhL]